MLVDLTLEDVRQGTRGDPESCVVTGPPGGAKR